MGLFYRYVLVIILIPSCLGFNVASWATTLRSFDGTNNNLAHPEWGSVGSNFVRVAPVAYVDQTSVPDIAGRPNPRSVSVALFQQTEPHPNARRLSGYVYAFGQFLSHDMQLTQTGQDEFISFRIPSNDDIFFPNQTVALTRSVFDPLTGTGPDNPQQQVNFSTSFIDASVVYGADEASASVLRGGPVNPGARLRTSNDINGDGQNLLPRDAFGPRPDADFVAGDSRVNDNVVLSSLHTLFMREHNRLVDGLAIEHPDWSEEDLYQRARRMVGAQLQAITYNEFLPALLGPLAPSPHGIYDPNIDPSIINEFPAVFLRIGHSMLTDSFLRIENDGQPASEGPIPLEDAFFNPSALATSRELELFLKGLTFEIQEETDLEMVFGIRAALLGAIDIQRARDHGLPDYNTFREAYQLPRVTSFTDITPDVAIQQTLEAIYGNVDSIDPIVGALAEAHLSDASVGPLVAAVYAEQFRRLRDGDRFWYQNDPDFTPEELDVLQRTTLADIIRRNTGVLEIPDNVFFSVIPEPTTFLILAGVASVLLFKARTGFTVRNHQQVKQAFSKTD
ncbi:peroxidase family protein [Bythopirellula goksoeyrii]|uniref:Peroxidase n=1 Tax=Bythopirellula goksoeyrii TaxID=1400387 RepID=A0A5B9QHE0_9BACT|nr:peroxidase family protein [Bythopirellula goksoeyrii]QEG37052.1 peroxidase [Bythopirellula goksoeyrii]